MEDSPTCTREGSHRLMLKGSRRPSGPTGRMEMEDGPTCTREGSHRSVEMENSLTCTQGSHRLERVLQIHGGFYNDMQASQMSNCRVPQVHVRWRRVSSHVERTREDFYDEM